MNQIEWSILSDPILCGVNRKGEPFSILILVSLVDVDNIHLERPRQGLNHSFGRSIFLWSVGHGGSLFFVLRSYGKLGRSRT